MRLPEFLTRLSPVGETLEAAEQGRALLEQETEKRNSQLSVSTAEDALSLWEADYSLPDGTGKRSAERRARIRTAMASGQTLTRDWLTALCVSVGGADSAEVVEDFPNWRVSVTALYEGSLPGDPADLERALQQMKPAHLQMDLAAECLLPSDRKRYLALTGNAFVVLTAQEGV